MQLASTVEEWHTLCANCRNSPFVHDRKGWDSRAKAKDGVLASLSTDAIEEITNTIEFAQGGLAHFAYGKANKELGNTRIDELFEVFGLSSILAARFMDKYCEEKGTCSLRYESMCTSNC